MINLIFLTISVVFGLSLVDDNQCDNTVFYEIPDSTGSIHLFRDLNEGSNYCWQHQKIEELVLTP